MTEIKSAITRRRLLRTAGAAGALGAAGTGVGTGREDGDRYVVCTSTGRGRSGHGVGELFDLLNRQF